MRLAPNFSARALLLLALGPLASLGCAAEERPPQSAFEYAENARAKYEEGVRAIESENWEGAAETLNDLKKRYSYSRYARLAELRLADADLAQDKYAEAVSGYKSFVHDYPNDPEVPYARYRVAKAQYDSVSQTVLMPPLEERDLAAVNDALVSIRQFLTDYPGSTYAAELRRASTSRAASSRPPSPAASTRSTPSTTRGSSPRPWSCSPRPTCSRRSAKKPAPSSSACSPSTRRAPSSSPPGASSPCSGP
jgi:outer membrane assembly lipoprotein YfiO